MGKIGLREELLRVEKEKNWQLLSADSQSLEVTTLEDLTLRKWGYEAFKGENIFISGSSFSPDAKRIAFLMGTEWWQPKSDYPIKGLYIINSDGSNLELLNKDFYPIGSADSAGICWSPDGRKIAFVGKPKIRDETKDIPPSKDFYGVPQDFYLIDVESRKVELLVENDIIRTISPQAWSSDSKEILYLTTHKEIKIYNLESKISRKLTQGSYPTWSKDGKWIIFDGGDGYYIIHPDGSGKKLLIPNKNQRFSYQALWSPDNKYLLLFSVGVRMLKLEEYITVYIMDFETEKIIKWGEGTVFTCWEGTPEN